MVCVAVCYLQYGGSCDEIIGAIAAVPDSTVAQTGQTVFGMSYRTVLEYWPGAAANATGVEKTDLFRVPIAYDSISWQNAIRNQLAAVIDRSRIESPVSPASPLTTAPMGQTTAVAVEIKSPPPGDAKSAAIELAPLSGSGSGGGAPTSPTGGVQSQSILRNVRIIRHPITLPIAVSVGDSKAEATTVPVLWHCVTDPNGDSASGLFVCILTLASPNQPPLQCFPANSHLKSDAASGGSGIAVAEPTVPHNPLIDVLRKYADTKRAKEAKARADEKESDARRMRGDDKAAAAALVPPGGSPPAVEISADERMKRGMIGSEYAEIVKASAFVFKSTRAMLSGSADASALPSAARWLDMCERTMRVLGRRPVSSITKMRRTFIYRSFAVLAVRTGISHHPTAFGDDLTPCFFMLIESDEF